MKGNKFLEVQQSQRIMQRFAKFLDDSEFVLALDEYGALVIMEQDEQDEDGIVCAYLDLDAVDDIAEDADSADDEAEEDDF